MDGCEVSQFAAHVSAVMGLESPGVSSGRATVMANLIGRDDVPSEIARHDATRVRLYGKQPRAGRKVGHVNVLADGCGGGLDEALEIAERIVANNVYAG